ncbi:MAG: glycosyl hydrolase, partial [Eudoraea sp.]
VPDTYKVKLIVGKEEFVREVEVLKDPTSEGTLEEIKDQVAFSLELRDAINLAVTMINDIEGIRSELAEIIPKLKNKDDIKKAEQLRILSESIAGTLYDIQLTGAREDAFRAPMKLYGRLSALASDITGNGVDFRPTDQQREVYAIFNERLKSIDKKFRDFMQDEVKNLNIQLKKSELQIQLDKKIKS